MSTTLHVKLADLVMAGVRVQFERRSEDDGEGIHHWAVAVTTFPGGRCFILDTFNDLTHLHGSVKDAELRRTLVTELCDLGVPFQVN